MVLWHFKRSIISPHQIHCTSWREATVCFFFKTFIFFNKKMIILFYSFPSNILIKENGRAAVGDMGHAKLTQRNGSGALSKSKSLFLSKNIIYGTECYLAPEVIKRTFFIEDETNDAYFAIDIWLVCLYQTRFTFVFNFS